MPMSEEKTGKKDYERLRVAAENLYIENGMDGREISKTLGVSEITVSSWKKEGEGEDKKNCLKVTPAKLRTKMLEEAERVMNGETCTINADAVSKLLAAADKLTRKATPDIIHAVLKECCTYITSVDPKFALQMAKYHRLFLQHKIETEG